MSLLLRRKSPSLNFVVVHGKAKTSQTKPKKSLVKKMTERKISSKINVMVSFDTEPVKGLFAKGVVEKKRWTTFKRLLKKYKIGRNSYVEDLTISGKPAGDIFNIRIVEKVEDGYYLLIKNLDAVDQLLVPMLTVFFENEEVSDSDIEDFEQWCD